MSAGILSFVTIMTVLVLFSVFLAREIIEVRRQTSFIDSVTHELRSPLASLRLCLQTQARPQLQPSQREQLREMMLDDVERLSALIDDILETSRLAQDLASRQIERVELGALVERCVSTTARRHRLEPSTIAVDVPPGIALETDPVALEVSLRNLLDNAIKYSDSPREIGLTAQPTPSGGLCIEVSDNGVGIPRNQLNRVFERFYRVDDETVRSRRGTGLGLFVASALIKGMRGRLRAHSEGPGQGTRMVITLPARIVAEPRSSSVAQEARSSREPSESDEVVSA